jgi:outer membrane cobalamin receptor
LIDSVNLSDVASFNDKSLPGYYQRSYGLRYSYLLNRWSYSAEADFKRNMFYDRSNLLKGDDVNLINLALRRYFKNSNIDFRVDNILDENIQYFRNRPTPGRSISLTYNQSF